MLNEYREKTLKFQVIIFLFIIMKKLQHLQNSTLQKSERLYSHKEPRGYHGGQKTA